MWFRVDDKLPMHVKSRRVRRSHPTKRRDAAPFGLWVLAGAFTDDGFIALEVLEEWDDNAEELAERLVSAGLWKHEQRAGELGYVFHDWDSMNPADASQAGIFGNHMRWHVGAGKPKAGCALCESEGLVPVAPSRPESPPNRPDDGPDIAPSIAPESLPDPIRPDPTRPDPTRERGAKRAHALPSDWQPRPETVDTIRTECPHLDLGAEHRKFADYYAGTGKPMKDWDATWRNWMRRANERPMRPTRQQETDDLFANAARRMGVIDNAPTIIEGAIA